MAAVILEESTQGLVFAPAEDGQGVILTGLGKCKNNEEITLGTYQGKCIVGIGKGALQGGRFTPSPCRQRSNLSKRVPLLSVQIWKGYIFST